MDTRRGGGTPEAGIRFAFKKKMILVEEVLPEWQAVDYTKKVVNKESDDELDGQYSTCVHSADDELK